MSLWWWLWWRAFIYVLMCVWHSVQWQKSIVNSTIPSVPWYSSPCCRTEHHSCPAGHLWASWRPTGVDAFFVATCLYVFVRDKAQCQGGPWLDPRQACCRPDEKLRKRLGFRDILSFLGIWLLYTHCTGARNWCSMILCVCVSGVTCVFVVVCGVMTHRLESGEVSEWTWNCLFRSMFW